MFLQIVYYLESEQTMDDGVLTINSGQVGLGLAPSLERTVFWDILDVDSVVLQTPVRLHLGVLLAVPLGETPVLAHEDLLASRELELGSSQGLDNLILELVVRSDRDENLTNLDTGCGAVSFAKGSSHSDVETVLATILDEILVAANSSSLQSLGGKLLKFVRDQMDAQGKLIDSSLPC